MRSSPTIEALIASGMVRRMSSGASGVHETGGGSGVTDDMPFVSLLSAGITHEWFGYTGAVSIHSRDDWRPPLTLLIAIIGEAVSSGRADLTSKSGLVVWIGRTCWPRCPGWWLSRSLFIDPLDAASRLWATDLALRCEGVSAVVSDGSRFDMRATRRLQLAAEAGKSAIGVIVRPPWERRELSAAGTRWAVNPQPSESRAARWRVELLRCKRAALSSHSLIRDERGCWVVDLSVDLGAQENIRGSCVERVSAGMVRRTGAEASGPKRRGEDRRSVA